MINVINIFFAAYFIMGAVLLPLGDFAKLPDIPKMYAQCKMTEDVDMTPFDFITDHLINIDGAFDKHDCGDHQKPHAPAPIDQLHQPNMTCTTVMLFDHPIQVVYFDSPRFWMSNEVPSDYFDRIFHPPTEA